jgi:hypothetical protein
MKATVEILAASILAFFLASLSFADVISVQAPATNPTVGDIFTLDVDATGVTDLYAFQFDLRFNPSLLSAISVTEGGFLPNGGPTFFILGTIDNVGGTVTATADSLLGAVSGVTGNGTLAEFEFEALGTGASTLSFAFANEILLDSSLNDITANTTFQSGSITISGGASVPEPNSLASVCIVLLALVVVRWFRGNFSGAFRTGTYFMRNSPWFVIAQSRIIYSICRIAISIFAALGILILCSISSAQSQCTYTYSKSPSGSPPLPTTLHFGYGSVGSGNFFFFPGASDDSFFYAIPSAACNTNPPDLPPNPQPPSVSLDVPWARVDAADYALPPQLGGGALGLAFGIGLDRQSNPLQVPRVAHLTLNGSDQFTVTQGTCESENPGGHSACSPLLLPNGSQLGLTIGQPIPSNASIGQAGFTPATYSVSGTLPSGVSLQMEAVSNSAFNGNGLNDFLDLTGTALPGSSSTGGKFPVSVSITDAGGRMATGTFTLNVVAPAVLNVPELSQNASPWSGLPYDDTNKTIGQEGCYLTDVTMLINYYAGAAVTSPDLLDKFLSSDFDASGNLIGYVSKNGEDGSVNELEVLKYAETKGVSLQWNGTVPFDSSVVNAYLQQGSPVLVSVSVPFSGESDNHWVIVTGQTTVNGTPTYSIIDPSSTYGASPDTLLRYNNQSGFMSIFSPGQPNKSAIKIGAFSPVELVLVDPAGNKVGLDPLTGTHYSSIPNASSYNLRFRDDTIPIGSNAAASYLSKHLDALSTSSGGYVIRATGTGSGSYTLKLVLYDMNGSPVEKVFTGTTISGSVAQYVLSYSHTSSSLTSVTAPCPADVNGDGIVNDADLAIIRASFGARVGQPNFNANADLNHDGVVNVIDSAFASKTFGCMTQAQ